MYIDFFLEEYSAKAMLEVLLPKILPLTVNWEIRDFRGKQQLLQKIPLLLKSYASWLPADHHVVILIDRDQEDWYQLKAQLEEIAAIAGLTSKNAITSGSFQVLNRIAIEELEAWFRGTLKQFAPPVLGFRSVLPTKRAFVTLTISKAALPKHSNRFCKMLDITLAD